MSIIRDAFSLLAKIREQGKPHYTLQRFPVTLASETDHELPTGWKPVAVFLIGEFQILATDYTVTHNGHNYIVVYTVASTGVSTILAEKI